MTMHINHYTEDEINSGLSELEPTIPWTHYFDFGYDIETVTEKNNKSYRKAIGLQKLNKLILELVKLHTCKGKLDGMTVLDVASAEGGHSLFMAQQGATVLGIEGRELYVKRAQFAANVLGCIGASFIKGDVRDISVKEIGQFDMTLCSGILHHLDQDSFKKFLNELYALTKDCLIIYTHVSTTESVKQFRLKGPVKIPGNYEGYLFREHKKNVTGEEKEKTVRASLNNTMSFWANKASLIRCLADVGFSSAYEILTPHLFSDPLKASFRPIIIARR